MARVPVELRVTLREGSIYYFQERTLSSAEPHFHIVVNEPLRQQALLLTVVSSKVEKVKHRRRDSLETVVELGPSDLPGILTRSSIIDCNRLIRISLEEFSERWARKEVAAFDKDLPTRLRSALRKAIHASKLVPDEIKALVAQP
jgi:hypothetical protein